MRGSVGLGDQNGLLEAILLGGDSFTTAFSPTHPRRSRGRHLPAYSPFHPHPSSSFPPHSNGITRSTPLNPLTTAQTPSPGRPVLSLSLLSPPFRKRGPVFPDDQNLPSPSTREQRRRSSPGFGKCRRWNLELEWGRLFHSRMRSTCRDLSWSRKPSIPWTMVTGGPTGSLLAQQRGRPPLLAPCPRRIDASPSVTLTPGKESKIQPNEKTIFWAASLGYPRGTNHPNALRTKTSTLHQSSVSNDQQVERDRIQSVGRPESFEGPSNSFASSLLLVISAVFRVGEELRSCLSRTLLGSLATGISFVRPLGDSRQSEISPEGCRNIGH
ncbi:unnamed protein product [Larinioides sclopetarius]|uniref:Uncharacterized protein n=1 Tax=Larinioides sclopetarius TaxID=280406 RepID=A0AAV2A5E5_9ARAC